MNQKVIDRYNEGQEVAHILNMSEYHVRIDFYGECPVDGFEEHLEIGFYEWLINPKYGVCRLFKVPHGGLISDKRLYEYKPVEEILSYLAGVK